MRLEFDPNASSGPHVSGGDENAKFTEALNAGIKAAQAGERKKARSLLMSAAEIDPKSENAWLWLASISEYPEELLVFLNNVLDINPENERALQWSISTKTLLSKTLVQRGIDAMEEGRKEFAMQCFDQAINYDERNQMAWLWIASMADSRERKMEYLERVLSIDPENETAKAEIQTAIQESVSARLAEARRLAVDGDHAGADALADQIIADFPDNKDAWALKCHLALGFEEKISVWTRSLEIDAGNSFASAGLESLQAMIDSIPAAVEPALDFPVETVKDPTQELVWPESLAVDPTKDDAEDVLDFPSAGSNNSEDGGSREHELSEEQPWPHYHEFRPVSAGDLLPQEENVQDRPTVDAFEMPDAFFVPDPVDETPNGDVVDFSEVDDLAIDDEDGIPMPPDPSSLEPVQLSADPYATKIEPRREVIEFEPVEDSGCATVLVIDDSATVRKLIAGKLEESGYRVVCAESGPDGMEIARSSKPSLVLLDVAMPQIDGYEVCRMIRESPETRNIPVIMISGKDAYYDESLGNAVGASGSITKPFGPEALMKTVESHLSVI